jgi:hypothetical protein
MIIKNVIHIYSDNNDLLFNLIICTLTQERSKASEANKYDDKKIVAFVRS